MRFKSLMVPVFLLISLSTVAIAAPYNYANLWMAWSTTAREAYVDGVTDGIAEAYILTMTTVAQDQFSKKPEPPQVANVRERLFVRDTRGSICAVITDLYKDPANAFIGSLGMFFIARDKIEGKDITKGIMEARKKAMETHRLNEEMKGYENAQSGSRGIFSPSPTPPARRFPKNIGP